MPCEVPSQQPPGGLGQGRLHVPEPCDSPELIPDLTETALQDRDPAGPQHDARAAGITFERNGDLGVRFGESAQSRQGQRTGGTHVGLVGGGDPELEGPVEVHEPRTVITELGADLATSGQRPYS